MNSSFLKHLFCVGALCFLSSASWALSSDNFDELEQQFERIEKMATDMLTEFEEDEAGFLTKMVKEPIDYDLLNKNIEKFTNSVVSESPEITNLSINFDSALTGWAHRAATVWGRYPYAPYSFPHAETGVNFQVDFAESFSSLLDVPVTINGFSVGIEVDQSAWSARGLVNPLLGLVGIDSLESTPGVSWTDTYEVELAVQLDTLDALKKMVAVDGIQESCENSEELLGEMGEDIAEFPEIQEVFEISCGIVATIPQQESFDSLMTEIHKPVRRINGLIDDAIDRAWRKELGNALSTGWKTFFKFLSRAFYHYDIKPVNCGVRDTIGIPCQKKFMIEAGGGVIAGDLDGELVVKEDSVSLKAIGDLSSGVRENFLDASKVELSAYAYIGAKVVESVNDDEIAAASKAVQLLMTELKADLEDEVNRGESILP